MFELHVNGLGWIVLYGALFLIGGGFYTMGYIAGYAAHRRARENGGAK